MAGRDTVSINRGDYLYHSKGISPDDGRYPMFFAVTTEIAMTYAVLSPTNRCVTYRNDKRRILLTLGGDTEEINHMLYAISDRSLANILTHILNVFFAKSANLDVVLASIDSLLLDLDPPEQLLGQNHLIERITTYHRLHPKVYAGFNKSVVTSMIRTLNTYRSKLLGYSGAKHIIPNRTTDRNFDMFLCNCLKMSRFAGLDGLFYKQIDLRGDRDYITQNEVIQGIDNVVVPTEICLFEGYSDLTLVAETCQKGGGNRYSLRTECNNRNISCRDSTGKYLSERQMLKLLNSAFIIENNKNNSSDLE